MGRREVHRHHPEHYSSDEEQAYDMSTYLPKTESRRLLRAGRLEGYSEALQLCLASARTRSQKSSEDPATFKRRQLALAWEELGIQTSTILGAQWDSLGTAPTLPAVNADACYLGQPAYLETPSADASFAHHVTAFVSQLPSLPERKNVSSKFRQGYFLQGTTPTEDHLDQVTRVLCFSDMTLQQRLHEVSSGLNCTLPFDHGQAFTGEKTLYKAASQLLDHGGAFMTMEQLIIGIRARAAELQGICFEEGYDRDEYLVDDTQVRADRNLPLTPAKARSKVKFRGKAVTAAVDAAREEEMAELRERVAAVEMAAGTDPGWPEPDPDYEPRVAQVASTEGMATRAYVDQAVAAVRGELQEHSTRLEKKIEATSGTLQSSFEAMANSLGAKLDTLGRTGSSGKGGRGDKKGGRGERTRGDGSCARCGEFGHFARECEHSLAEAKVKKDAKAAKEAKDEGTSPEPLSLDSADTTASPPQAPKTSEWSSPPIQDVMAAALQQVLQVNQGFLAGTLGILTVDQNPGPSPQPRQASPSQGPILVDEGPSRVGTSGAPVKDCAKRVPLKSDSTGDNAALLHPDAPGPHLSDECPEEEREAEEPPLQSGQSAPAQVAAVNSLDHPLDLAALDEPPRELHVSPEVEDKVESPAIVEMGDRIPERESKDEEREMGPDDETLAAIREANGLQGFLAKRGGATEAANRLRPWRWSQPAKDPTPEMAIQAWQQVRGGMRNKLAPLEIWRRGWEAVHATTLAITGASTVEKAIEGAVERVEAQTETSRIRASSDTGGKAQRKYSDVREALRSLESHYARRRAEQCPLRAVTVQDTIRTTAGVKKAKSQSGCQIDQLIHELQEPSHEMRPDRVSERLGDAVYGLMTYEEAFEETLQAHRVQVYVNQTLVRRWREQVEKSKDKESLEEEDEQGRQEAWWLIRRWKKRARGTGQRCAASRSAPRSTTHRSLVNDARRDRLRGLVNRTLRTSWESARVRKASRVLEQKVKRAEIEQRRFKAVSRALREIPADTYGPHRKADIEMLEAQNDRAIRHQELKEYLSVSKALETAHLEGRRNKSSRTEKAAQLRKSRKMVGALVQSISPDREEVRPPPKESSKIQYWHSMLVNVRVTEDGQERWEEQLADSGSAVTIQKARALHSAFRPEDMAAPAPLVQADGAPLRGLIGAAPVTFALQPLEAGEEAVEYTHVSQIATAGKLMPIIGVDFWQRYNAVKDYASQTISLDKPGDRSEKPERITIAMRTHRSETEEEDRRVTRGCHALAPATIVNTVARADRDIVLEPGTRSATALPFKVGGCPSAMRAATVFSAMPVVKVKTRESLDPSPSRHAVGSEEEKPQPSKEKGTPEAEEGDETMTMMEHFVHPLVDPEDNVVKVYLPVANPGVDRLVIRKGEVYALLNELTEDERISQEEWDEYEAQAKLEECLRVSRVSPSSPENGQAAEKATLGHDIDSLEPEDPLHNKSRQEVIRMVEEGKQFGAHGLSYKEWCEKNKADLKFGPRCPPDRQEECTKILYATSDALASNNNKPGILKGFEHKIELLDPNVEPTKIKTRRYPPAQKEAIKKEVEKMLANDIIEPSDSPWAAPIVMVKKKDGTWRFCVDYRVTINPICKKDAMPLPKIPDLLEKLSKAKEMSVVDICSGYWSLLVRQCDRKYLAFNSETHGLMTFKRMPFGMATSGATMQRSMETILRGDTSGPEAYDRLGPILGELAQVYIDDISIWSTDNDHLDDLLRVMKVLKKNNVTLKLKKCVWCTDEAKLCGFEVRCGDGISADLEKVAGIAAITSLPDLGSLKSFLGSCVYLSRFIKDFATLTAPLYELEKQYKCLTTKINGARWEAQHQRSFEGVKAALASAPVLAFPNFDKPFILLSDCSEIAMGGVLLQIDDDGVERPIAYASRRLNQAEKNYKITDKEGAAGIFCIRKFRSYLLGQPTVWITDHSALTSLRSKQHFDSARMARYAMELMEYDLDIMHRPGRHCHIPDLLSRADVEADPDKRIQMVKDLLKKKAVECIRGLESPEEEAKAEAQLGLTSPAERVIRDGDLGAYDTAEVERHIKLLVLGADTSNAETRTVDPSKPTPTLRERITAITEAMEAGLHQAKLGVPLFEDCIEDDPRMIEAYDRACSGPDPVTTTKMPLRVAPTRSGCDHAKADTMESIPNQEEMRSLQKADPELVKIREGLEAKPQEDTAQNPVRSVLKKRWEMEDGVLMKIGIQKDTLGNLVEVKTISVPSPEALEKKGPTSITQRIIRTIHQYVAAHAHLGPMATYQILKSRFSWPGMKEEALDFVKRCPQCQQFGKAPKTGGYGEHLSANRPGQKWVVDLLYLEKDGKFIGALTMVDVFSRWVIVRPIQTATAEEVARNLQQAWAEAGVHFIPEDVIHDNGSEFKQVFKQVCELISVNQNWSVANRPESHGVIEKFNQDVSHMLGKRIHARSGITAGYPIKPFEKKWTWSLPAVMAAINSSPSRATSTASGAVGYSRSEVFHGQRAVFPVDLALQPRLSPVDHTNHGIEEHMLAVQESQKRAIEFVNSARAAYEQECDRALANQSKVLRAFQPGDSVMKKVIRQGVESKTNPTYEGPYIVIKDGRRGNYLIQEFRNFDADATWAHVDQLRKFYPVRIQEQSHTRDAQNQVQAAVKRLYDEYDIEEIYEMRGAAAAREYLVKWSGYPEPTWQAFSSESEKTDIFHQFRKRWKDRAPKPKPKTDSRVSRVSLGKDASVTQGPVKAAKKVGRSSSKILHPGTYQSMTVGVPTGVEYFERHDLGMEQHLLQTDILAWSPARLIATICKAQGWRPEQILFIWASPPCRTFSNSAYNQGRGTSGHGYNYRDFNDPKRGPCCQKEECPYRQMAVRHDRFVPWLQQMFQHLQDNEIDCDMGIENPRACLERRPYMQLESWPGSIPFSKHAIDMCAYNHPAQKPTHFWTSMTDYRPQGMTGDGRCHRRCSAGSYNEEGGYHHPVAFAQEPARQPRGSDRVAIPAPWAREVLSHALRHRRNADCNIVIDLFCGHRSLAPVAHQMGLRYVGVDIDRLPGVPF